MGYFLDFLHSIENNIMKKKIEIFSLLSFLVIALTFCSKDEMTDPTGSIDDPDDPIVESLDPSMASSYLVIENAVKNDGNPPAATVDQPSFDLLIESYNAVPENGFSIVFEADENFEGIYLQVKGANEYFDVPATSANSLRQQITKEKAISLARTDDNFELSINLIEDAELGEFCVDICVYDESGNISIIEEFCVTIKNWGGNSELVGKWKYAKIEEFSNNVLTDTDATDWGYLDSTQYYGHCNDTTPEIATIERFEWIELESNGNYTDNYLDGIISITPDCDQEDVLDVYYGKWSYNEATNEITIVDFEVRNDINNFPNNPEYFESYEGGDLYISGLVQTLTSNSLVIKHTGNDPESDWHELIYFERIP